MLFMRLWPSLAGPWPRCRRSPPVAKLAAVWGTPWAGLWPGPAWLWPGSGPASPSPPVRFRRRVQRARDATQARACGAGPGPVWPVAWARFPASPGGRPPGGVVRLVARVDVWTSWPWWWISGTPPPASRPSRSRRCPAAPGGIQSPALPGPRPGPAVRRRARPCRPAASACRRSTSWPWWTRGKVRIPARMPKPAPGPERRSRPPPHAARSRSSSICICPSVGLHGWMDVWYIY